MAGVLSSPELIISHDRDNNQQERNDTNFLHSGPYIDLPVNHPTRIVNILFGGLFVVVVPFVYYCIFRYNEDSDDDNF